MTESHLIAAAVAREAARLRRIGVDDEQARLRAIGLVERAREAARLGSIGLPTRGRPRRVA